MVEAEVPGVKREDVNIELVGNELTITGEIKEKERRASFVARRDAWDASNSESRFLTKSTRRRSTPSSPKACWPSEFEVGSGHSAARSRSRGSEPA